MACPVRTAPRANVATTSVPDREIAATVDYVCAEALANVARHSGAQSARVELTAAEDWLTVSVTDDGAGDADPAAGSGLRGLRDRVRLAADLPVR